MKIKNLLKKNGPLTSSSIKNKLVESGISDEAARKRISRATHGIERFDKIRFPKNIQFLYLPSHLRSPSIFRQALLNALAETDSIHFHALEALKAFGSRSTKSNFLVLSGCPTNRKKKKVVEDLIKELENANLIYLFLQNKEQYIGYVKPEALPGKSISNPSIIMTLQELLFSPIEDWLRNNSLVSFNKIKRFSNFAGYYWHLTAPSYLLPLIKREASTIKPGFLVVDVFPQDDIQKNHIEYFIAKCDGCSFQRNVRPFLPVLIGNSFSIQALKYAKKKNVFVTTPRNLFGDDVANAIDSLVRILKDTAKFLRHADEKAVFNIINKVAKIEGKTNNVRGQLFELVSGHIVFNEGYPTIEVGLEIQDSNGNRAEIDVFAKRNRAEIKIIECKGFSSKSQINVTDIEKWFERIRTIRNWAKTHQEYFHARLIFEYWASSGFSPDAKELLVSKQSKVKNFSIRWRSGKEIIKLAHDLKLTSMVKLLREHYVKDAVY